MAMIHTNMVTDQSSLVNTSPASLQPAAKGSLVCSCSGTVIEMSGKYGWLSVHGNVEHPLAGKRGGHIYVSSRDVVDGSWLKAGDVVSFCLYVDDQGLGAESVRLQQRAAPAFTSNTSNYVAAQHNKWQATSTWGSSKWATAYSLQAVQFVPMQYPMVATPALQCASREDESATVELTEDGLPSVGSVGHEDGSCKRCAFHSKGRCQNGTACGHCHYDHADRTRVRRRANRKGAPEYTPEEYIHMAEENKAKQSHSTSMWEVETVAPSATSDEESSSPVSPDLEPSSPPSLSATSDDGNVSTLGGSDHTGSCDELCPSSDKSSRDASDSESEAEEAFGTLLKTPEQKPRGLPTFADFLQAPPVDGSQRKQKDFCPSPTSWAAQQRLRKTSMAEASDEKSTAEVARTARSLLNKLTQDRFDSLTDQIVALPICTPEQLGALVGEIFEKATTQDGFRSLYTELCMRLDAHFSEEIGAIGGKAFRKALATECQKTFEGYLQPFNAAIYKGLKCDAAFEAEMKQKTRRLGNMRFIGELLTRRLLAHKLMLPIIHELIDSNEAALESLIALLTVVAPFFEGQQASAYQASLKDTFATLRRRKSDKSISSRVRCQLSDLFDAKARGWTSRSV